MGGGSWTQSDWNNYSTTTRAKPQQQRFSQTIQNDMNPNGVKMREARDSADHRESNAIIVALDETGSMGKIPHQLVIDGLGTLVNEILTRQPVKDPQLMFMGIGDAFTDRSPLQVGQFESDIRMAEWLSKLYLEGNGGGNNGESYHLAWYFAAMHTSIDCFEKRGKKGYLFTIGDEHCHPVLHKKHIESIMGDALEADLSTQELLDMVSRSYHVYHLMITEGYSCDDKVQDGWRNLLGERAIKVSDYRNVPEVIVSIIQSNEGTASADEIIKSWSGDTSLVVADAIRSLTPASKASGGVVRL
jgi:hypothetical protein